MKTFNDERNGEESENEDRGGTTQRRRQRWRWRKERKIVIISLGLTRWRRGKMHCDITRNRREALRYNRCMRLNRLFPPRIIVAVFEFLSSHSLLSFLSRARALYRPGFRSRFTTCNLSPFLGRHSFSPSFLLEIRYFSRSRLRGISWRRAIHVTFYNFSRWNFLGKCPYFNTENETQ